MQNVLNTIFEIEIEPGITYVTKHIPMQSQSLFLYNVYTLFLEICSLQIVRIAEPQMALVNIAAIRYASLVNVIVCDTDFVPKLKQCIFFVQKDFPNNYYPSL